LFPINPIDGGENKEVMVVKHAIINPFEKNTSMIDAITM
jgi:hypothetical protein